MSATPILSTPVAFTVEALGWTLLHFVWQGAVVALALWIVLFLARKASPQVRYLAGCGALCLMCIAAGSTFVWCLDGSRLGTAESPAVAQADSAMLSAVSSSGVLPPARTDTADLRDNARDTTEAPIVAHSVRVEEAPAVSQVSVVSSDALKSLPEAAARWGQRLEPWLPGIVALWALGVAFLSLRLLAGWRAVRRLRATAQEIPDEAWNPRFSRLKERLGVLYPVRLVCSASAGVPMVIGWLKPAVILPAGLITGLSPEQLEAILAHELIHIRRHDYLINLLQNVVETLLFYHPAVAWVSKRIRVEREHCCDDAALLVSGGVLDYARALAALAELRRGPALSVAVTGGSLVDRIRRLAGAAETDSGRGAPVPLPSLLLVLAVVCAAAAITRAAWAEQKDAATEPSPAAAATEKTKLLPSREERGDDMTVRGQVLKPDGQPASGARISAVRYYFHNFASRPAEPPLAITTAGNDGKFELTYHKSQFAVGMARPEQWKEAFILAEADGFGLQAAGWQAIDAAKLLTLKLTPDFPIHGRVVDLEGRPLSGVSVRATGVSESKTGNLDPWLDAVRSGADSPQAWRLGKLKELGPFDDQAGRALTTDQEGRFTLKGIGKERRVELELRGDSTAYATITAVTRPLKPLTRQVFSSFFSSKDQVFGCEFTFQAHPARAIVGTVRDAASGKPLPGVGVASDVFAGVRVSGLHQLWTETDAQGRYRLVGMPKGNGNEIMAFPNDDQPYLMRSIVVPDSPGMGPITVDIGLHRGVWITGRVVDKLTNQPVMSQLHYFPFLDNSFARKLPEFRSGNVQGDQARYKTRSDGTFRLVGLPGRAIVGADPISHNYRTGSGASDIKGIDARGHFATYFNPIMPGLKWPTALKEINPAERADSVVCDFALEPGETIRIALVDRDGKPVSGSTVTGRTPHDYQRPVESTFAVTNLFPKETRPIVIYHKERDLGKVLLLALDEKTPRTMTVKLEPCATLVGRIVDEDGVPILGISLEASPTPGGDFWPRLPAVVGRADGKFAYCGLLPGCDYAIQATGPDIDPQSATDKVKIQPGKTIDLGDVKLKRRGFASAGFSKPKNPALAPKTLSADAVKPPGRPAAPSPTENTAQRDAPAVIRGSVLQPDGRPAAGARVAAFRYDLQFTPRPNRPPLASTTADHDGRFELTLPKSQFRKGTGRPNPLRVGFILAEADGFGFQAVDWAAIDAAQPLTLKLTPDFPIRGRVVDLEGRPVPGVTVLPTHVNESQTGSLDLWLGAVKAGHPSALSWELGKLNWIAAFDDQPNRTMTTDSDGRFTLTGIGPERLVGLELRGESTAFTFVNVATRPMRPLTRLLLGLPVPRKDQVFGSEFTCQVNPSRVIVGTVSDAATGEPLKGVGVAGDRWGRMWTETDAQGRYRLVGVPKGRGSQIMAFPNDDQPYFLRGLEVPDGPGIGPITVDFKLHRGLWITGRVIDQVTRQPVMARLHYLPFLDNRFLGKLPEFGEGGLSVSEMRYTTRPNGTFRLVGLPGRAIVGALSLSPHYRTGQGAEQINGVDKNGHFPTFSNPAPAGLKWPTAIKEINPAEGSNSVKCDFVLEPGGTIHIALVDREGKPVNGATVTGRMPMEARAPVESKFEVANLSPNETRPVVIFDKQRDIGKVLMLTFDEKTPRTMTVTLEPSATVTGRIVDEDGAPVTAAGLLAFPLPGGDFWPTLPPGAVQADGRFEYRGLLAGAECRIVASPPDLYPQTLVDKFTVQPGKTIDLGEIKLKRRGLTDVGFSKPKNPVPAPKTPSAEAVKPPGRPATPSPKENTAQSDAPAVIHGTVLRPDGKPATDATVSLYAFHWSSGDRIRWEPIASRGTNSHGEFELVAPPSDASGSDDKFFFATAKGLGCDYQLHFSLDPSKPLVMKLAPDRPIRGRILDLEGKPVAGARVRVVTVTDSADRGVGPWIDAMRSGVERYSSAAHSLLGKFVKTLPGGAGSTTTDQDGRFVLQGLGAERVVDLAIESDTTAYRQVTVVTRSLDPIIRPAAARGAGLEIFGADFTTSASPTRPVVGTVRDEKTGKPLEGVSIESRRFASESFAGQRGLRTTSDAQGKYRLLGMPKGIGNAIFVVPNDEQPYFMRQLEVPDPSGIEPVTVDIQLHRGLWITGRVTDKETGKPVRARVNYWPFLTNTHTGGLPEFGPGRNMQGDDARYPTRPDGTFRVPGLPGRGLVGAEAMVDHYRQGAGASEIHDVDREGRLRTYRNQGWPSLKYPTTMKEINPTDGTESIICNLVCDHGETVRITVLDSDGKPVHNCSTSVPTKNGKVRGIDSAFELNNLPLNVVQPLLIAQKERNLAKFITFTLKEQSPHSLTVKLEPCATVIGRLVDEDGTPLKGISVDPRFRRGGDFWPSFPAVVCQSDGRFEYPGLPAGATFDFFHEGAAIGSLQFSGPVIPEPGKTIDLGEIKLKRRGFADVGFSKPKNPAPAPKTRTANATNRQRAAAPVAAEVTFSYEGKVVDDVGRPVAGAQLMLQYWREGPAELQAPPLAVTDEHGRFKFTRTKSEFADAVPTGIPAWRYATIVATKDGLGFAFDSSEQFETSGRLMAEPTEEQRRRFKTQTADKPAVLKLVPDDVPVRGRLVNIEGQPIAGAVVRTVSVFSGMDGTLDTWVAATKQRGADWNTADRGLRRINGANSAIVPVVRTDADGRFTLRGIGRERIADILVSAPNVETRLLHVLSRQGEPIKLAFDRPSAVNLQFESFYPNEFTGLLGPSIPVEGRITDRKTARPLADCVVKAGYTPLDPHSGLRPSSRLASDYLRTLTDSEGRYRLEGLPLGKSKLMVVPPIGTRHLQRDFDVTTTAGSQPLTSDVRLTAGILVRGQVTDSRTSKPVMGNLDYQPAETNPDRLQTDRYGRGQYRYATDQEGRFEIPVLPGKGLLLFRAKGFSDDYPRGMFADHVDGLRAAPANEFRDFPYLTYTSNAHLSVPIDLEPQPDELSVRLTLRSGVSVSGRVLTPEGQPLSGYYLFSTLSGPVGVSRTNGAWRYHEAETFTLAGYFPTESRTLMFYHSARNLVGVYSLSGEPPEKLEITLHPGAKILGRLIDEVGLPLKNAVISRRGRQYPPPAGEAAHDRELGVILTELNGRHVLTDQDGRFELPGIIPGLKYSADVRIPQDEPGKMSRSIFGQIFTDVTAGPGEVKQLGELRVKPSR